MDDSHDEYVLSHETRLRYFWLSDNVCYDVCARLTHVNELPGDEAAEDWNYWAIYDDHCTCVSQYRWFGVYTKEGEDCFDPIWDHLLLQYEVNGETREFDLDEHMYRLFKGCYESFLAWDVSASIPDELREQVLGELVLLKCYRRSWCGRPDQKNMGHDPHCGQRYQL